MGTTRYTAEDRAGNRWGVHDHEGWVGKVLDDGSIVDGGPVSDVDRRTVAWRAACSCGWLSDTVLPRPEGADAWPEWEEVPALDVEWIAHTDPYLEALARAHGVLTETEPAVAGEAPAAPVVVDEDFAPVRRAGTAQYLCDAARRGGVTITQAAEGVPTVAQCPCGAEWRRPIGDDYADTLAGWTRDHLPADLDP